MSLRSKVLLLVVALSVAFAGTAWFVQRATVLPEFARIELDLARDDVARCLYALERDSDFLASSSTDYGAWDDTYRFIEDANDEYKSENLIPETFKNLRLNLLAFVRKDGALVWGELRKADGGDLIDAPELMADLSRPEHPLHAHASAESRIHGVFLTPNGPMLIGSSAITTSNRDGAVRGSVLMARFIDASTVEELVRRTRVDMKLTTLDDAGPDGRSALARLHAPQEVWTDTSGDDALRSYTRVPDILGRPALLLASALPRAVNQRAIAAGRTALATNVAGGLAWILLMWLALSRLVIDPVARVTRHAVRVGAEGDLRARLNLHSRDEIGVLASEFDRMVDRLAQARAGMLAVAHDAGKAQVAADVLHNVGNVLNSVNVSANLIDEKLRASEAPTVRMAANLLLENGRSLTEFLERDERGKRLPTFLAELGEQLIAEQAMLLREVGSLAQAVEHMRTVVSAQQAHSHGRPLIEWIRPAELVEQALALSADSFQRHGIHVRRRIDWNTEIQVDKHRLLQILVNLLSNARNALKSVTTSPREIELGVQEAGDDRLRIDVRDNGQGIAAEHLDRIFAGGFSTRADGRGIGLHSAANLASEMGGSLTVCSDGPGRGATFSVTIPLARRAEVAA